MGASRLATLDFVRGVAVLGVDALHYFWTRRTPDEVARDLAPPITDRMAYFCRRMAKFLVHLLT